MSLLGRPYVAALSHLVQLMIWDQWPPNEPTPWPWRGIVPFPGQASPLVIQAAALEELAERISARLDVLRGARFLSSAIVPAVRLAPSSVQGFYDAVKGVMLELFKEQKPEPGVRARAAEEVLVGA